LPFFKRRHPCVKLRLSETRSRHRPMAPPQNKFAVRSTTTTASVLRPPSISLSFGVFHSSPHPPKSRFFRISPEEGEDVTVVRPIPVVTRSSQTCCSYTKRTSQNSPGLEGNPDELQSNQSTCHQKHLPDTRSRDVPCSYHRLSGVSQRSDTAKPVLLAGRHPVLPSRAGIQTVSRGRCIASRTCGRKAQSQVTATSPPHGCIRGHRPRCNPTGNRPAA